MRAGWQRVRIKTESLAIELTAVRDSRKMAPTLPRTLKLESEFCAIEWHDSMAILRMISDDGTNRLSIARVRALTDALTFLAAQKPAKLIITGNTHFFSAGADLREIAALTGPKAFRFAQMGQQLMNAVAGFLRPLSPQSTDTAWEVALTWHWLANDVSAVHTPYSVIAAQLSALSRDGAELNACRASSAEAER